MFAGETFLGASDVRYDAGPTAEVLKSSSRRASSGMPSEHETLTGAVGGELRRPAGRPQGVRRARGTSPTWRTRPGGTPGPSRWPRRADQFGPDRAARGRTGRRRGRDRPCLLLRPVPRRAPGRPGHALPADARSVGRIWELAVKRGVIPRALAARSPPRSCGPSRTGLRRHAQGGRAGALAGASTLRGSC